MMEWATAFLHERTVDQPRLSIEWLLAHVLQVPRLNLYLMFDRPLTAQELEQLRPLVKRRAKHEPLQYITGTASFLGVEFHVGPDVLIPRPETEELVELALSEMEQGPIADAKKDPTSATSHATSAPVPTSATARDTVRALDVGTGSGCIAISLALRRPEWRVFATDISEQALVVARKNAARLDSPVQFTHHDLMSDVALTDLRELDIAADQNRNVEESPDSGIGTYTSARFDLILSNPPYIHPDEAVDMDRQVKDHEPHLALFHPDPLLVVSRLIALAQRSLTQQGRLYIELNPRVADQALERARQCFHHAEVIKDLSGHRRFLHATIPLAQTQA